MGRVGGDGLDGGDRCMGGGGWHWWQPPLAYSWPSTTIHLRLLRNCIWNLDTSGRLTHIDSPLATTTPPFSCRDELRKRLEELRTGEAKVRELIDTLDLRKNEAIERTFKQVAKNFGEIFAELVPGGRGQLVMIKVTGVWVATGRVLAGSLVREWWHGTCIRKCGRLLMPDRGAAVLLA